MNTCPVYRRSGGYSYGSTIPGPIGSILSPGFDLQKYSSLPFASTLCGSCADVCPVKIDIHKQLYNWRQIITEKTHVSFSKKIIMKATGLVFSHPKIFQLSSKFAKGFLRTIPRSLVNNLSGKWTKQRELPETPGYTFAEWYKKNRKQNEIG